MSTIKKNFIYNFIYQILILIIPLVSSPYLARTIGSEGVGIYSYTYSIVYYFMLFTLLGVNNYGNRSIAQVRNDESKLASTFWNIYMMQLVLGILLLFIYFMLVVILFNDYKIFFLVESMFILSAILDINWFFFGIEDFKCTITRNSIVKIGSLILIFIFVKTSNDVLKYVLIMSSMTLLSQILMWNFLFKKIKFQKPKFIEVIKHIRPNLILFLPVIAVSIYKVMDKVMLGALSNMSEVGFFENAEKIISIPMALIASLGTVMLPRMSNVLAKGDYSSVRKYISKSIHFIMFLAYPICFGLITISYNFAPLFFGNEFQKTGILIMILSTTLPILSFANVLRTQYLIPKEKDKVFLNSSLYGAVVNVIVNVLLIKNLHSIGACIATIFAELTVMLYQCVKVKKELPVLKYFIETSIFFFKGLIMFIFIYWINFINIANILKILIQCLLGMLIYFMLNIKYISSIINIKKILKLK